MATGNYSNSPTFPGETGATTGATGSTGSTAGGAKEQAQQAAGTAAQETKHVAGVAQGEAQKVVGEAKSHVQGLLGEATSQLEDQSRTQRDRLVETLRSLGDDLNGMAGESHGGLATDLARQVADRAHDLSSRVDGREPRELLDDVRDFARRKPGVFLLGALAAGVVAGRLTRGAKDASNGATGSPAYAAVPQGQGTATGTPLAGTGTPGTVPVYPAGSDLAADPATDVYPTPATSVSADTTWSDTPNRGGLA